MTAETLRAVRVKAELLNGGASLGEAGDAVAEMAVERALAYCQRTNVPRDMEQAVGALALALWASIPPDRERIRRGPGGGRNRLRGHWRGGL